MPPLELVTARLPRCSIPGAVVGALLLTAVAVNAPLAGAMEAVHIERAPLREFGYQLGDVITEHLTLTLAPGLRLDPLSLPRAGKRAGWFLVRSVTSRESPGPGGTQIVHLTLEVQLTNSPLAARQLTVPAVALRFLGPEPRVDTIPSLTVDAVPLSTGEVRTGLPDVRPLRPDPPVPSAAPRDLLARCLPVAALLAVWCVVAVGLRRWRPRSPGPFEEAARALRPLLPSASAPDGARLAVQRLHRAFDLAAGQRLFADGVQAFCQRVGADADLQARTRAFFQTSQTLFFDAGTPAIPQSLPDELSGLCEAWRSFERRHR